MTKLKFLAELISTGKMVTLIELPRDVIAALGARSQVSVRGTINERRRFRALTLPSGEGKQYLLINKETREAVGATAGEIVSVEIERDEKRPVRMKG